MANDLDWFSIAVTEAGTLQASTTGTTDTFGEIWDSSVRLEKDDDSGTSGNFDVSIAVTPGIYYIKIRGLVTRTGAYTLTVSFTAGGDDHGDDRDSATLVAFDTPTAGNIEVANDLDWFSIAVTEAGTLQASTTGTTDTVGDIWDSSIRLQSDDDSGPGSNFDVSTAVTPGTYYIKVRGFDTATGAYTLTVSFTAGAVGGDLIVEAPTVSSNSITVGGSFDLSATVNNQGSGNAATTTLRWYRSSDATISTTDTLQGTDTVAALAAGATSDETFSVTAPDTAGTYHYGACVEAVTGEADTNNNCSTSIAVAVGTVPDLIIEVPTVSSNSVAIGDDFSLSATVHNQGNDTAPGPITLRFYRSDDATIDTNDDRIGTQLINPDIDAGASSTDKSIGQTAEAPTGSYWYGACVDTVARRG